MNFWSGVVYFADIPKLADIVFLDPQWLTRRVIGSLLFFLGGEVDDLSNDEQRHLQEEREFRKFKDGAVITKNDLRGAWHFLVSSNLGR